MDKNPRLDVTSTATENIRAAIEGLSKDDLYRLELAARALLFGTEFREPGEIIHEAMVRVMGGSRRWPCQSVPFVAFVIMTMWSIADASRNSAEQARMVSVDAFAVEGVPWSESPWAGVMASPEEAQIELEHDAERQRSAAMDIERIGRHFESDTRVRLLIACLKDGRSAYEIRAELRWSDGEYATVRKRLRRGLAKLFRTRRTP